VATVKKPAPAFRRLDVDVRRAQLLEAGARLFTEQGYEGVSMNDIARAAGISKGLLYHYFPSKHELFAATLEAAARELAALTATDPSAPPLEQVVQALDAYLGWIEANADSYVALLGAAGSVGEAGQLVEQVREATARRILEGLGARGRRAKELDVAVRGWLWAIDGACLRWLERRDVPRERLRDMLLAMLAAVALAES
jgi:AcrR family transcriptional regulator